MGKLINKLVGKKIVVVGGSSGIGFGAAEAFVAVGAHVTIVSSSQAKVDSAVERLKQVEIEVQVQVQVGADGPVTPPAGVVADVRDEEAFTAVLRELAPIDHLVFSAVDLIIRGPLAEADLDAARHLFGVKFWGSVAVGKALARYDIVRPGGSLTLTSGSAACRSGKDAAIGAALNAAVINLTQNLAQDLSSSSPSSRRVRVNTVVPGLVRTELWDKLGRSAADQAQLFAAAAESLSVGFVATPAEIAEAYLYLVRADYANGTVVLIDGGSSNVA